MRHSRLTGLAIAAGLVLLTGCSSLNPFASSGPKPAELTAFQPSAELRPLWQTRVGSSGGFDFRPAVVGDDVYAAANDGSVIRIREGSVAWRSGVGQRLSAGVGSDGRLAVVVTTAGEVVALDAGSGAERWRHEARMEVLAPPAVVGSTVVVRASDGTLIGLAASDGARRWEYRRPVPTLTLRRSFAMTVEEPVAIVGYPGGKLVAIHAENGGVLWELTVATPRGVTELERITDVVGTPVLWRQEICAVTYQGRAGCFDLTNGNALWSREFSSSVGMDRDTRFAFITDASDAVHGLDAFSGAPVWKQDSMARRNVSRPLVAGDFVVVGDLDGYVHLLERESGRFAARTRADSSAIVADPQSLGGQRFVVQTRDGGVHAFEAR